MKFSRIYLLLVALLLLCTNWHERLTAEDREGIIIPDMWVREALASKHKDSAVAKARLIRELQSYIEEKNLEFRGREEFGVWSILQVLIFDLDSDGVAECLITADAHQSGYLFIVCKRSDSDWKVIFRDEILSHETAFNPLIVASAEDRTLFYREEVSPSGGGRDFLNSSYRIYQVIDNQVHSVAEVEGDWRTWGSDLSYLNSAIRCRLHFSDQRIFATYNYSIYPAVSDESERYSKWTPHEEETFITGEIELCYEWNQDQLSFVQDSVDSSRAVMVSHLRSVEESDIIDAFRAEFDSVRTIASGKKKELLEYVFQKLEERR